MRKFFSIQVGMILAIILAGCSSPPPVQTVEAESLGLKPGDAIGGMIIGTTPNKNIEASLFNYCDSHAADPRPVVIVSDCEVPRLKYLFVGYGDFASSTSELDALWETESWELYINGRRIDLSAFGTFDLDLGNKIRVWNVALANITPGYHQIRYVLRSANDPDAVTDLTWTFTMVDKEVKTPTPSPVAAPATYPVLSSEFSPGLNPYRSKEANLNFMFYTPSGYGSDPTQAWPLLLYLHGIGLRGSDLNELRLGELTSILQYETDFPFLVVAPQMPSGDENTSWSRDAMVTSLFVLLDEVQDKYSVDPKRIYLTGTSLGGAGTWEIGLRYPDRFAALVPVMGFYGYPFEIPDHICDLKDVPIWAFHGDRDLTVPLSAERGLVEALLACGGNVQFTVYENAGHDVDARTYKNPDLYTWMLEQSLR